MELHRDMWTYNLVGYAKKHAASSFIGILWAVIMSFIGGTVIGWASTICIICFMGGIQLVSLGVIGEYIGKIYNETKSRPRFIIEEFINK